MQTKQINYAQSGYVREVVIVRRGHGVYFIL